MRENVHHYVTVQIITRENVHQYVTVQIITRENVHHYVINTSVNPDHMIFEIMIVSVFLIVRQCSALVLL